MRQVVPSTIISFLEETYPWLKGGQPDSSPRDPGTVHGLLELLNRVSEELLQMTPEDFSKFITVREELRAGLELNRRWRPFNGAEVEAIRTVHRLLKACPDDAAPVSTAGLEFVSDADLRADLRRDLGEVNKALLNGEWKGATVLAGSITEALLLWALQNKRTEADLQAAASKMGRVVDLTKRPLDRWDLHDLIEFAHESELISESTRIAADQGRDFRNLIHPGKAMRLARKCNRSTSLLGVGATEAVIDDLS